MSEKTVSGRRLTRKESRILRSEFSAVATINANSRFTEGTVSIPIGTPNIKVHAIRFVFERASQQIDWGHKITAFINFHTGVNSLANVQMAVSEVFAPTNYMEFLNVDEMRLTGVENLTVTYGVGIVSGNPSATDRDVSFRIELFYEPIRF